MKKYKSIKLGQALLALAVSVVAWPSASAEETRSTATWPSRSAYEYRLLSTDKGRGYRAYILEMTSQTFLTKADVDRTLWKHSVIIVKPTKVRHHTGMLMITGGSNGKEPPTKASDMVADRREPDRWCGAQDGAEPAAAFHRRGSRPLRGRLHRLHLDKYLRTGDELACPFANDQGWRPRDGHNHRFSGQAGERFRDGRQVRGGWRVQARMDHLGVAAVDKRVVAIVPIDMLNVVLLFKHHYRAYGPAGGEGLSGDASWAGRTRVQAADEVC